MPAEFVDGFDYYSDPATKWGATVGQGSVVINPTAGRDGRGALVANQAFAVWTGPAATRRTLGFAFKGSSATNTPIAAFKISSTNLNACSIRWDFGFTLSVLKGDALVSATVLGTSTATLPADTWGYLELRYTSSVATATDDIVLRLNGAPIVTVAAGTNTGTTTFDQVIVGSPSGALNAFTATVDDVVILDQFEGFWGDVVVEGKVPAAAGTYSQFTPVGDSPNWKCVAGINSSYVDATDHRRDTYAFPPLLQNPQQIRAVQVSMVAKQVGPVPGTLAPVLGTDQTPITPTGSDVMYLSRYPLNPATGLAWTSADIAAVEFGIVT